MKDKTAIILLSILAAVSIGLSLNFPDPPEIVFGEINIDADRTGFGLAKKTNSEKSFKTSNTQQTHAAKGF